MKSVLLFTFTCKLIVAIHCYGHCAQVCVTEVPTGGNFKTWPIQVKTKFILLAFVTEKCIFLGPLLLHYVPFLVSSVMNV